MLVDAVAFQVFSQGCLDSLIEGREVGTGILFDLAFKAMELFDLVDVVSDLHTVVVDLGINSGSLDNQASVFTGICDKDCEVTVVLGFRATFFILGRVLAVRILLVIRDRLSRFESDFDDFVSDLLFQRHEDAL